MLSVWPRLLYIQGMSRRPTLFFALLALISGLPVATQSNLRGAQSREVPHNFLGVDRNEYPGDDALPILRKTFSFASYWIGPPPGGKSSTWLGKRELLQSQGFGFVVLFSGRDSRSLRTVALAHEKGVEDAKNAAKSAHQEGFPTGTTIFLDIEEGGRLPDSYHEYVRAWFDALAAANFSVGVYCSAMPVQEGAGTSITTARDLQDHMGTRNLKYWVYNDSCPPSPGCFFSSEAPSPSISGFAGATIWQYAQSPRRKEFTAHCPTNYAPDGNCYAPEDTAQKWFLDANVAASPDPSAPKR